MAFLNDRVYDNGLSAISSEASALYICTQLPTNFTEATSTYACGAATGAAMPSVSSPGTRSGGGREVTVGATTNGTVSATLTATHVALVDSSANRLLAARALVSSQGVTSGNPFTLTSFTIGIPAVAT
jgi:hypothetical protein